MRIGMTELLIILAIVVVIFGPSQIPKLSQMLGQAVKKMRNKVNGTSEQTPPWSKATERGKHKRRVREIPWRRQGRTSIRGSVSCLVVRPAEPGCLFKQSSFASLCSVQGAAPLAMLRIYPCIAKKESSLDARLLSFLAFSSCSTGFTGQRQTDAV